MIIIVIVIIMVQSRVTIYLALTRCDDNKLAKRDLIGRYIELWFLFVLIIVVLLLLFCVRTNENNDNHLLFHPAKRHFVYSNRALVLSLPLFLFLSHTRLLSTSAHNLAPIVWQVNNLKFAKTQNWSNGLDHRQRKQTDEQPLGGLVPLIANIIILILIIELRDQCLALQVQLYCSTGHGSFSQLTQLKLEVRYHSDWSYIQSHEIEIVRFLKRFDLICL